MKKTLIISLFLLTTILSFGQKMEWIPFNWKGSQVSGKYFDKLAITIPVSVDNLPHKFNLQLDLGAITTVFYGNSINPYFEKYPHLKSKIDTTLTFRMQSQTNFKLKNVELKLGSVNFGKKNIGIFKNYGNKIPKDSVNTKSEKHIGTIAPDLFQDKILIIDYAKKRIGVTEKLPAAYSNATFMPYKIKDGRIKIPLTIDSKNEDLLFDTGASLFSLITTEARANKITEDKIVDSLKISSWGKYYMVYGKKEKTNVKFGSKTLQQTIIYYDKQKGNEKFYTEEEIWGITGNAYFLNNIVIIDYKKKLFGIK
jgi:hypothetical protein